GGSRLPGRSEGSGAGCRGGAGGRLPRRAPPARGRRRREGRRIGCGLSGVSFSVRSFDGGVRRRLGDLEGAEAILVKAAREKLFEVEARPPRLALDLGIFALGVGGLLPRGERLERADLHRVVLR